MSVKKRTPEQGRIVITLEYTMPRTYWSEYADDGKRIITDAVDCLRQNVQDWKDGALSLGDLIQGADEIHVEATK
ncbi:hypothetical protein J4U00_gp054 [Mycobacterium phage DyoEdafos]|uniref:Uncharacterized protein n=1 Tax=Mycobacterium phage DyoEdafos TaxID=2599860 RepID=A0A5J6TH37_9CAUD|nr:hypothetical protein J4U00_gp054 [Mycobacterium phage DyoEdafos]QFG10283.1 hypothetical protein SEA_DYOEDAFOS_54 [Mycobacterium phage DyoEdafos]